MFVGRVRKPWGAALFNQCLCNFLRHCVVSPCSASTRNHGQRMPINAKFAESCLVSYAGTPFVHPVS